VSSRGREINPARSARPSEGRSHCLVPEFRRAAFFPFLRAEALGKSPDATPIYFVDKGNDLGDDQCIAVMARVTAPDEPRHGAEGGNHGEEALFSKSAGANLSARKARLQSQTAEELGIGFPEC
jgi:hypothetical protein